MILILLLLIPLIGISFIVIESNYGILINNIRIKSIALFTFIVYFIIYFK